MTRKFWIALTAMFAAAWGLIAGLTCPFLHFSGGWVVATLPAAILSGYCAGKVLSD